MSWLTNMLSNGTDLSSARVINFLGAINGGAMLAYTTYTGTLNPELFAIYLAYCGGTYSFGKYFDTKTTNA
jgi:hypothetical protein